MLLPHTHTHARTSLFNFLHKKKVQGKEYTFKATDRDDGQDWFAAVAASATTK